MYDNVTGNSRRNSSVMTTLILIFMATKNKQKDGMVESLIAFSILFDVHHLVTGINLLIYFVWSLAIYDQSFLIYLLV